MRAWICGSIFSFVGWASFFTHALMISERTLISLTLTLPMNLKMNSGSWGQFGQKFGDCDLSRSEERAARGDYVVDYMNSLSLRERARVREFCRVDELFCPRVMTNKQPQ